jgi:hypothetical protein
MPVFILKHIILDRAKNMNDDQRRRMAAQVAMSFMNQFGIDDDDDDE